MIAIINYGMGNLGSIQNMLKRLGVASVVTSNKDEINKAQKIILPGVGAFDHAMKNLKELDLMEILSEKAQQAKTPILGICLGMQIMTKGSEEGSLPGFGWVDAYTRKFKFDQTQASLKIPHMGWNTLELKKESALFDKMPNGLRFYFVHSYQVSCQQPENVVALTHHGYDFVSVFTNQNITGVQFHPEKSHQFGMQMLKNFAELPC